jgi:hypothetical protein
MSPEELHAVMTYIQQRVTLSDSGGKEITFDQPDEAELIPVGGDAEAVRRLLTSDWWPEMVEEIVETADFCEPDDSPEQVLTYARDVVVEYIRKRFQP